MQGEVDTDEIADGFAVSLHYLLIIGEEEINFAIGTLERPSKLFA